MASKMATKANGRNRNLLFEAGRPDITNRLREFANIPLGALGNHDRRVKGDISAYCHSEWKRKMFLDSCKRE